MAASMWAARAAEYSVTSPNGKLRVTLNVADGDKTTYAVSLLKDDGVWRPLISPSEIAMNIKGGYVWGKDATVSAVAYDTLTAAAPRTIPLLYGKTSALTEAYREALVTFSQGYSLAIRAYDEGAAYRFISHVADGDTTRIASEKATFAFAETVKVWYPAMSNLDKMGDDENYERWYTKFGSISGIDASLSANNNDFQWCVTPVLFGFDDGEGVKVAITEADLHSYPTLYLQPAAGNSMKGFWSPYPKETTYGDMYTGPKIKEYADYLSENIGAHKYPWRVAIVAEEDKDLLTNQLVMLLSSPQKEGIDFSFVKPGKSAWEYWHDADLENPKVPSGWDNISVEGNGFNLYKEYIDFAKKYGFGYITIDTDGRNGLTQNDERRLFAYAKESGVGVVKWTYIAYVLQARQHMQELKDRGASCAKVDFFYRTDQIFTQEIEWLARSAAEAKMSLLLHGCPVPHGLHRTYPNILSYEAVAGTENYKWDGPTAPRLPDAEYHVEIPFIRQLVGAMDYTPGSLRNVHKREYYPKGGVPMSIGTRAHELAMYVMYDMFIGYLCDNPMEYGRHPEIMKYLSRVPSAWDESVALDGKVGQSAVVAKRSGRAWFVGGMTNESARTLEVDFSFLPAGADYTARIYRDDSVASEADAKAMLIEDISVTNDDKLAIGCSSEGGFVMQLFEKGSADDPDVATAVNKTDSRDKRAATVYYSAGSASLTIKSPENIRAVAVVNMQGGVVAKQKYSGSTTKEVADVAHLPAGIYIVNVETPAGAYVAKFFKD
jgi:alpha-glucosidase